MRPVKIEIKILEPAGKAVSFVGVVSVARDDQGDCGQRGGFYPDPATEPYRRFHEAPRRRS